MNEAVRKYWPAELVVQALQREGVDTLFGLLGGHVQAIQDFAYRAGMDVFQVRHEQAAAHAADGYARMRRRPGVMFATAGPGMTNCVTGLHMAYLARSPVVALLGGHTVREEGRGGTAQEADPRSVLASVTKWTKRVMVPEQVDLFVRQAFRDAMTYPYGPVALEFPVDIVNFRPMDAADQLGHLTDGHLGRPPAVGARADDVRTAARLLTEARRPLVLGGDGIHWDEAGDALGAVLERLGLPVALRRLARGSVAESHPLVIPATVRKEAIARADVVLVLGMHMDYFESFGEWRTDARFIQVNRHPSEAALTLPTILEVTADTRSFLEDLGRQILASGAAKTDPGWMGELTDLTNSWQEQRDTVVVANRGNERIHPQVFAAELSAAVPDDVPVLLDSFTASGHLTQFLQPTFSGAVQDAGLSAAFGHGVGMALGMSVGRGFRPVVSVLGDGGIGLAGGDIETAARYGIPAVFVVYNNSTLCGGLEDYAYGEGFRLLGPKARGGFNVSQDVAYHDMFAVLGVHTELVTEATEVGPALQRALASGGPAVVNVIADARVQHSLFDSSHSREMMWYLPIDEVEEPARKRHHETLYPRYHQGRSLREDLGGPSTSEPATT